MTIMRSPLGRARGLGSAKEGLAAFFALRLTAIALVPLCLWFVISVIGLIGADYDQFREFLGNPGNAALMTLFILAGFYHAMLGMQEVIVDYVHCKKMLVLSLLLLKLMTAALSAFLVLSVVKLGFGV